MPLMEEQVSASEEVLTDLLEKLADMVRQQESGANGGSWSMCRQTGCSKGGVASIVEVALVCRMREVIVYLPDPTKSGKVSHYYCITAALMSIQGLEDSVSSWFDGDSLQSFFEFQVKGQHCT